MNTLTWIIVTTLAGGLLSAFVAGLFAIKAKPAQVPMLVSYAVGALLGAAFIEVLPHAFYQSDSIERRPGPCSRAFWLSSSSRNWCCGGTAMLRNAKRTIRTIRRNTTTAAAA